MAVLQSLISPWNRKGKKRKKEIITTRGICIWSTTEVLRGQGWDSGESARLQPMCPGFDFQTRVICGLSLLFVFFLAPRGFSPGTPVFPSPQKPTFPNFNSIWNCQALYHEPLARLIAQALPVFDIKFTFTLHYYNPADSARNRA